MNDEDEEGDDKPKKEKKKTSADVLNDVIMSKADIT